MVHSSRQLLPRLLRLGLVLLLCFSVGLHWVLLQSTAWVGMTLKYSLQSGSLSQGLEQTFDGDHPCPLCKAVQRGVQGEEGDNDKPGAPTKIGKPMPQDREMAGPVLRPPHRLSEPLGLQRQSLAMRRHVAPLLPPPRVG